MLQAVLHVAGCVACCNVWRVVYCLLHVAYGTRHMACGMLRVAVHGGMWHAALCLLHMACHISHGCVGGTLHHVPFHDSTLTRMLQVGDADIEPI